MLKVLAWMPTTALVLSAYAFENIQAGGDAKLYYTTDDQGANADFADRRSSAADMALRVGVSAELSENTSAGATGYALTSLGLENSAVSDVWSGAHEASGGSMDDAAWIGELWIAGNVANTIVKAGRMELDTPLIYSEKWSVAPNTFDAAVVVNRDIPDTDVAALWVGKGNGVNLGGAAGLSASAKNSIGIDRFMAKGAGFGTFGESGAYAAGILNRSCKGIHAQAWYFNLGRLADAFWLQADSDPAQLGGLLLGLQYANMNPKGELSAYAITRAYAARIGYAGFENWKLSVAYSKVGDFGVLKVANTATDNLIDADSKLYTETLWNRGYVGAINAESVKVMIEYDMEHIALITASYVGVNNAEDDFTANDQDIEEFALTASRSFGSVDTKLAYLSSDLSGNDNGGRYDTLIAYMTLNF